jgi:hypothetical protein
MVGSRRRSRQQKAGHDDDGESSEHDQLAMHEPRLGTDHADPAPSMCQRTAAANAHKLPAMLVSYHLAAIVFFSSTVSHSRG